VPWSLTDEMMQDGTSASHLQDERIVAPRGYWKREMSQHRRYPLEQPTNHQLFVISHVNNDVVFRDLEQDHHQDPASFVDYTDVKHQNSWRPSERPPR
jgi:hypothetical protein